MPDWVRSEIGRGESEAELAIADAIGVFIGLRHRGGHRMKLLASLPEEKQGATRDMSSVRQKIHTKAIFCVPEQRDQINGEKAIWSTEDTRISPLALPIITGDQIEWPFDSGRWYTVLDDGVEPIHQGYSYLVTCDACKPLTLGQAS